MTVILDGKKLADKIASNLKEEVAKLHKKPKLAVIIVGENPASKIYVNLKHKKALEIGIESLVISLPEDISEVDLIRHISELNNDKSVNGILVQLPLPKHINSSRIIEMIDYSKDVDGFHLMNVGKTFAGFEPAAYPCTPRGIIKLLDEYNIEIEGKNVVIIGRSMIVGRPLAAMLLNRNATVTVCHSKTKNLQQISANADILVAAIGKPKMIKSDWVKDGAVVIDIGISKLDSGKLSGDVDFDLVKDKASYITPVPGGVGPMTIVCLMENTYNLYKSQNKSNFVTKP